MFIFLKSSLKVVIYLRIGFELKQLLHKVITTYLFRLGLGVE